MEKKQFGKEFKLQIIQELSSGKKVSQISQEHDLKQGLIWGWKREYNKDPVHAFAGKGNPVTEVTLTSKLERKIGQQAMEIDFLKQVNNSLQSALVELKKNAR